MKKILAKAVLTAGICLAPICYSQDTEPINYIPAYMENLIDYNAREGLKINRLDKSERNAAIANSIFLYEGYADISVSQAKKQSFPERYLYNLERELQEVDALRILNLSKEVVWEDLDYLPFEREAYSALGRTLIEKYQIARDVDQGIQKLRDATTIHLSSESGFKYRLGLFVGKFEIEAAGIFFKAKKGSFNAGITGCQNEIESFLEKRFGIGYLGARYSYIRDINGAEEERRVYLSFKVSDF